MSEIKLKTPNDNATVTLKSQNTTGDASFNLTLPVTDGDAGQFLKTDGSGVLSFDTVDSTPEGTVIKSTTNGNEAATKYLRANGSGGASWESVIADTFGGLTGTTIATSNPLVTTNPADGTGHLWINKTSGNAWVCSDATNNANVWKNLKGSGDIEPTFTVDYLVLAGAGSGGWGGYGDASGGGGGGGLRQSWNNETSGGGGSSESSITLTTGTTYTITVGAGGSNAKGGDSSLSGSGLTTITANGGGKGNGRGDAANNSGGCGGGWAYLAYTGGTGTANQGYDGATGGSGTQPGGAGGGTGSAGSGGTGGNGTTSTITGSSVSYGRGGYNEATGGGRGAGADALGEGGNGSDGDPWGNGGDGGDGVVILRMPTGNWNASGISGGSYTVSTSGTDTIVKWTVGGTWTP